jgi:hypothetical protein
LQGFDRILGREPTHEQRKFGIVCHVNRSGLNSLNVLGATATVHFHNEFYLLHFFILLGKNLDKSAVHFFEVEYWPESGLPHSKQHVFVLGVTNP